MDSWAVASGNYLADMVHILLHFVVPAAIAAAIARDRWLRVWLILIATMVVDVDHLLANPVYDPERCSIGFHPLHSSPALAGYLLLFVSPAVARRIGNGRVSTVVSTLGLIGLGLVVHMVLDGADCLA